MKLFFMVLVMLTSATSIGMMFYHLWISAGGFFWAFLFAFCCLIAKGISEWDYL